MIDATLEIRRLNDSFRRRGGKRRMTAGIARRAGNLALMRAQSYRGQAGPGASAASKQRASGLRRASLLPIQSRFPRNSNFGRHRVLRGRATVN
jgi:hypothetical protein